LDSVPNKVKEDLWLVGCVCVCSFTQNYLFNHMHTDINPSELRASVSFMEVIFSLVYEKL